MEKVVISLGGSVLIPDEGDGEYLIRLASLLARLSNEYDIFAVCGGGRVARYYIRTGRDIGASEDELDWIGIEITRINARLLQLALRDHANGILPDTVAEAARNAISGRVTLMGGTTPGHTTDGVAASLAEAVKAERIVNATSVDGIYDRDPKKDPAAKKYDRLSCRQLAEMLSGKHGAGSSGVFDAMGAEIIARCRVPVYVVYGRDLAEMERAIRGQRINGTIIEG